MITFLKLYWRTPQYSYTVDFILIPISDPFHCLLRQSCKILSMGQVHDCVRIVWKINVYMHVPPSPSMYITLLSPI